MLYHESALTVSCKLICFAVMSLFLPSGYAVYAKATGNTAMAAVQLPVIILLCSYLLISNIKAIYDLS